MQASAAERIILELGSCAHYRSHLIGVRGNPSAEVIVLGPDLHTWSRSLILHSFPEALLYHFHKIISHAHCIVTSVRVLIFFVKL